MGYNVLTGPHTELGVIEGRLTAVPDSPNAVSSYALSTEHAMEPISFAGSSKQALGRVRTLVESMPRARIVVIKDNYLRAKFESSFFRFVDDVEFLIQEATSVIHFRSASRLGHSDLGANRARMEKIKRCFEQQQSQSMTE